MPVWLIIITWFFIGWVGGIVTAIIFDTAYQGVHLNEEIAKREARKMRPCGHCKNFAFEYRPEGLLGHGPCRKHKEIKREDETCADWRAAK